MTDDAHHGAQIRDNVDDFPPATLALVRPVKFHLTFQKERLESLTDTAARFRCHEGSRHQVLLPIVCPDGG